MKKKKWFFLSVAICIVSVSTYAQHNEASTYSLLKKGFKNPPNSASPKVYWWCLNRNIDTVRAKRELTDMKNAGIAGFDFFEIGVPKGDTMIPAGPAFLSDASLKVIQFVVKQAGNLGLEMGLNLASSWNAGGSWTLPKNAGKSLYYSKIGIDGGAKTQKIKVPSPEISFPKKSLISGTGKPMIPLQQNGRPVYYEDEAVLAIPTEVKEHSLDTSEVINVTRFFDPKSDLLEWKAPPGKWQILRYVCSNSGQQLVLPSPHSAGLTIDHFDSTAVRTHLMYIINRLRPVLGDFRKTALKIFYLASYEARGFVWTSSLPSEFKKLNGYDIYKFLPSFYDKELVGTETHTKVQTDFKKTLSELMINNLYKESKKICSRYGIKINSEAGGPGYPLYNGPAKPLKALGSLDIPRGEFWVNHPSYYMDPNGNDSIDILRVVKEAAAASHIYKRSIIEEEAFTPFQNWQWQEGPFDMKPSGDQVFCEGMNRVVFHGFSHNPKGTGFAGIVYHAGTHFNDKRVWWPMVKPFIDYVSRNSYIFQQANFVADVLYYYGDKVPNSAIPKNTHFVAGPGYDYEVINTEILLNDLTVKNGKLLLSNGATFSMLALDKEEEINPFVLVKLSELAKAGAVIIGAKPSTVGDINGKPATKEKPLIQQLWTTVADPSKVHIGQNGKIFADIKPSEILHSLEVPSDLTYSDKESWLLDFIHYGKNDIDFYFIRNTSDQWVSRLCGFRQQSKVPEMWNPINGEVVSVPMFDQQGPYINFSRTFAPYGAYLVVFKRNGNVAPYTSVSTSGQNPPMMQFASGRLLFLNDGNFELKSKGGSKEIDNKPKRQTIDGSWDVSFTKGWGAPDSIVFPELTSWTSNENPCIKHYSGVGIYHKEFRFDQKLPASKTQKIFIDLGEISKVAVKVANTWSNRITGDAITGKKFTSTNITVSRKGIKWSDSPLIPSGPLGPITIQSSKIFK